MMKKENTDAMNQNKKEKITKDKRKFRYGTNATILTVVIVVAVVLLNFVFVTLNDKIPLSLDFTQDKITKLTDETVETLKNLDQDITVKYFTNDEKKDQYVQKMLDKYQQKSEHIKVELVDPVKNPSVTKQYAENNNLVTMNSVVFEMGSRYKTIDSNDYYSSSSQNQNMMAINVEKQFTNAILYLMADKMPQAYLTAGHGETEMTQARANLEGVNYEVKTIDLLSEDIPQEDSIVMIAAPTKDFTAEEIDKLDRYIDKGGNVQVYFDPSIDGSAPRLESYLADEWGISRENTDAIESDRSKLYSIYGQMFVSSAEISAESKAAGELASANAPIVVPVCNPIKLADAAPAGVEYDEILTLSSTAISKKEGNTKIEKEDGDGEGPFNVMVGATRTVYDNNTNESTTGKLVVSGSLVAFETLGQEGQFANYDLFRTVSGWMLESKELTSISPKISMMETVNIPQGHIPVWIVILAVILPLAILVAGLVVWGKRRYR